MAQALPQYQSGAPAVLNDSAILDLTQAQGVVAQLSSQKLSNVYGCPIAVKEIRFFAQTWPISGVVQEGVAPFDFGSIIQAFVSVNNVNLMQNPIFIRSLGTLLQTNLTYGYQFFNLHGDTGPCYNSTLYRWVFPQPLFIPRNASFDIKINAIAKAARPYDPSAVIPTCKVDVAVVGTLQPDLQGMMAPYPYVAEFAPAVSIRAATGKPAFAMGNDPIFRNVFANPLMLNRLVASLYEGTDYYADLKTDVLGLYPNVVNTRIWDSKGNNMVGYGGGNAIPLGGLVNPQDGNWFIERTLDQYEWLNVELYPQTNADFNTQPIWYPRVAFHGSHMQLFAP